MAWQGWHRWSSRAFVFLSLIGCSFQLAVADPSASSSSIVPVTADPDLLTYRLSPDGIVRAVDNTGRTCWSFSSGGPVDASSSSLVLVERLDDAQEDLRDHVKNVISQTPLFTDEGVLMGASTKTIFVVDPTTGVLLHKFHANGSTSSKDAGRFLVDDLKPVFFQRTDHSLQCFEVSTGNVKWSVRFAEIASLNEETTAYTRDNESNSLVVSDANFQGPTFTPVSVHSNDLIPRLLKNTTTIAELQSQLQPPFLPPAIEPARLPSPGAMIGFHGREQSTRLLLLRAGIITGVLSGIALLAVILKSVFMRKPEKQAEKLAVVEHKKKTNKGKRKNRKGGNSEQEAASKGDYDRLADQEDTNIVNGTVKIGKLTMTGTLIGHGSHGTRVLEGCLDGRPVAVKCLLSDFYEVAEKEIRALIELDAHPNVVRYYTMEQDKNFVYIALERCQYNLDVFIQLQATNALPEGIQLWDRSSLPTPSLMKIMRDVVEGLVYLHKLGYVHRDLKPQNVLVNCIDSKLVAKVSDMGLSKRLSDGMSSIDYSFASRVGTSGWSAPEQIQRGRQTRAVDMFNVGCLLYFCITAGQHPFGAPLERDLNITKGNMDLFPIDHMPEAMNLLTSLLSLDPEKRLKAMDVKLHPFFWYPQKRLNFLIAASDRVEREDREATSSVLDALEGVAYEAVGGSWKEKLDESLIENLGKYRSYNFQAVRDLLRVIRNKANHYRELPAELQQRLGTVPDGYESYFRIRFPKLLIEVYKVLWDHCREEVGFQLYFHQDY